MTMMFLALSMSDKLESSFKTQFQCHVFCVSLSLTFPINNWSEVPIFDDSLIQILFECILYTRYSPGH